MKWNILLNVHVRIIRCLQAWNCDWDSRFLLLKHRCFQILQMSVGFLELLSQGSLSLRTSSLLLQLSLDFPQTLLQTLELMQDQITHATVTTGLLWMIHLNTNTNINTDDLSQIYLPGVWRDLVRLKCDKISRQGEKLPRDIAMTECEGEIRIKYLPLCLHYASTVILLFIEIKII